MRNAGHGKSVPATTPPSIPIKRNVLRIVSFHYLARKEFKVLSSNFRSSKIFLNSKFYTYFIFPSSKFSKRKVISKFIPINKVLTHF